MSRFTLDREKTIGSIEAKLYSYTEKNAELSTYIRRKVSQSKPNFVDILNKYGNAELDKNKLLENYARLTTPDNHKIPAFDTKRSTVTEFMAEFLLEREFQCIFFEQANKKLKRSVVDTNRHSPGIDVVGVQEKEDSLKFVVAEVKASQEKAIPCDSADSLKKDIDRALNLENKRLSREVLSMIESLNEFQYADKYITFLLDLIEQPDSPRRFIQSIIIFPFLIRKNPEILQQKSLDDYKDFSELDTKGAEIVGIVWAINKDIEQFVKSIYSND